MTKTTEAKWRKVIREQESSGLTVQAFASRRGINASTLFWWRSRLQRGGLEEPGLVAVEVLDAEPAGHGGVIELQICGDIVLRLPPGFVEADLRHVLAVLAKPC